MLLPYSVKYHAVKETLGFTLARLGDAFYEMFRSIEKTITGKVFYLNRPKAYLRREYINLVFSPEIESIAAAIYYAEEGRP